MELDGTTGNGEVGGPRSAVGIEKPPAAGLTIGADRIDIESCADGVVDSSGEGINKMIGANWPTRFDDRAAGWIVAKEATAGVVTDDSASVGRASTPEETCEVARSRVGP